MHTPLSHLGAWFVALALLLTACALSLIHI